MYYGDFKLGRTITIPFNTFDSNDPQASVTVTNLVNTDVHIHRDDNLTQRNNAGGITVNINFDSITGNHLLVIDTNDDTVQGFWQVGHDYNVRLEGITVDVGTLNVWVGAFSIENRYNPTSETPSYSVTSDWELNEQFKLSGLGIITTLSEDTGKNPIFQWELDELSTAGMVSTDRPRHEVNIGSISNDYDSADNAELDYDGTGYNKVNSTSDQLVDDMMDEVITGATHNVNNSLAKYIREASASVAAVSGTAQAGAAGSITLASGAVGTDDKFNGERVAIIDGTGVGQSRLITDSTASTDVCLVNHDWIVNPDDTSVYALTGGEADVRMVSGQDVSATATVDFDDIAATLADTNELQTDWVDAGRLDAILDAILAMLDDPRAEPGQGAPAVNADAMTKLDYLYKAWRNKSTQTATAYSLYNDAGDTIDQASTDSDNGTTATKGEVGTGA